MSAWAELASKIGRQNGEPNGQICFSACRGLAFANRGKHLGKNVRARVEKRLIFEALTPARQEHYRAGRCARNYPGIERLPDLPDAPLGELGPLGSTKDHQNGPNPLVPGVCTLLLPKYAARETIKCTVARKSGGTSRKAV
jgi:hypothetical protein